VANKGVTGYGTWKRVRKMGDWERIGIGERMRKNIWFEGRHPAVFVKADSKGFTGVTFCKCGK
jgi:hypothetical protein